MRGKSGRNKWVLFLFLLAGMVLGSFAGFALNRFAFFEWLDYGQYFGISNPVTLSLGVVSLTFGFTLRINVASVIGMVLGYIAYRLADK